MKSRILSVCLGAALAAFPFVLPAQISGPPPIDCGCVSNLPALQATCPGTVPDLCAIATNCFSTNMLPGSCTQGIAPGAQYPVGTYILNFQVLNLQSNAVSCAVPFVVSPPVPTPKLTVTCPTNKTVECGSGWYFDLPIIVSSCCGVSMPATDIVVSNAFCSQVVTRVWQITDGCGNNQTCSQTVTVVDTTPPGTQCGQNLVPNGNFESYTNCPDAIARFDYAAPWFTPSGGTSDYFNSCSGVGSYVNTPGNLLGSQVPLSGQGYAGAVMWTRFGLNPPDVQQDYREYLEVPLSAMLSPGQKYQVSFYVSRADNCQYAVAEIGAYFSAGPLLTNVTYQKNFPVVPQVENSATNLLLSASSWMLVQGTFIATGGEAYLTIGNFRTDTNTTFAVLPPGSFGDYAYYYFDDVTVTAVCDSTLTNKTVQCGSAWTLDPLPIFDNCSGNNVTATSFTTTNGYCPRVITRTWSLADQCGNSNTITQVVTIVDTNPPILLCAAGANLAPNPQFENYAYCPYFFSQVDDAVPWFTPTVATPDYMNSCSSFAPVSVPNNYFGNQTPFSGQGYVGAFVYSVYGTNPIGGYREYIEAPLLAPLVAGVTYQVSFHVSLSDYSAWAISQLGAHFSTGALLNGYTQGPLNVVPQVVNPAGNPLTSTNGWMLVQGNYTAVGGEDHITLGNFLNDASTTAVPAAGTNALTYYYYDDVKVVALCSGSFTNKIVQCGIAWDFDFPLAYDECSGDFLSTSILSTTSTGVCPQVHTRVWTISDACMNSIMATQTVTVVDTVPPVPLCSGVNLVPNPGFEYYGLCPTTSANLSDASPWYSPSDGTSDYYNACAGGPNISVPTNFAGVQNAYAGQGYAGSYVYAPGNAVATNSYREYLQTPLSAPLIAGWSYTVTFYVSRADNYAWAVADLGAYLSVGPVTNYVGMGNVIQVIPQVANASSNILASSTGWMQIQGTFIAAGGENYLTLGNFRSDAATTAALGAGPYANAAYYYYDEVSVIANCVPSNKVVACGSPLTFDPPIGVDLCSGTNVTVTVVSTVTNSLCPPSIQRTWRLVDACGNSNLWTQSVSVSNNAPLVVNCGCLQDSILSLLTTNACSGVIPNLSVLTNSPCITSGCGVLNITQSPAAGTPVGAGYHPVTIFVSNCSGGATNSCVLPFYVNPPQPVITCPANIYVTACTGSVVVNYTVTATNYNGTIVCSPPSGTAFPIGTNVVICTATNNCGGSSVNGFYVIVRPVSLKFGCFTKAINIITIPTGTARVIELPDFPGGGVGVDFANLGSSGQDGARFDIGPAQKFSFSTYLDFAAPNGASFSLALPPGPGETNDTPIFTATRRNPPGNWDIKLNKRTVASPDATFRSIAIGTNGQLFSSFVHDGASLDTNVLVSLSAAGGATGAVMTVTLDCRTRELTLEFPSCSWTPDTARKGWNGSIYGNHPPRGSVGDQTARVILTPLATVISPPITTVDLLTSNLTQIAFDNPSLTASGRKWGDGHVTLMKAYDDGTESGMEFYSLGSGGGVKVDLGHAASFRAKITRFETGDVPTQEQFFSVRGWPPGTTTNRPPPPVFNLRLARNAGGTGVDCAADFTQWGVSNVTVQLWNGGALVAETNHVPATLASSLVTLGGFPGILGCPGVGVVSLNDTNPISVISGLACSSGACSGTELRIQAEPTAQSSPPPAFMGLDCFISEGMDNLIHGLQTTPACTPVPLHFNATPDGVILVWQGEGFRLQGAETVVGPWYDLGVGSPVTLPPSSALRLFRLVCD